ncbi:MAG TPA: hypothetical protein VGZ00_12320 [Candidatus Baltobacteraceae bacterium]|jgi:hypothetical protein|nr:hypothetical protein [Candidatus Baltobacteraceae bacterium]
MTHLDPPKQDSHLCNEALTVGKIRTKFTAIATGQAFAYGCEQQTRAAWFLELSANTQLDAIIETSVSLDEVLINPEAFEKLEQAIESLPKLSPGQHVQTLDPAGAYPTSVLEFHEDVGRIANMVTDNPERGHAASVIRFMKDVDPAATIVRPAEIHQALLEPCLTYIKLQLTELTKGRAQSRSESMIPQEDHSNSRCANRRPLDAYRFM